MNLQVDAAIRGIALLRISTERRGGRQIKIVANIPIDGDVFGA
jgi:hypothetical protein